jgi:hypothetical protein
MTEIENKRAKERQSARAVAASPTDKVFSTSQYMLKEAYASSAKAAEAKRLRYLARNCPSDQTEIVKGLVAEKSCSLAFKESLAETLALLNHS